MVNPFEDEETRPPRSGPVPPWLAALEQITEAQGNVTRLVPMAERVQSLPSDRRLAYMVHLTPPASGDGVRVEVAAQRRNRDGLWEDPTPYTFSADAWYNAPAGEDRLIANLLLGTADATHLTGMPAGGFVLPPRAFEPTLRLICETGRAMVKSQRPRLHGRALQWDAGAPYTTRVHVNGTPDTGFVLTATLERAAPATVAPDTAAGTASGTVTVPVHTVDYFIGNDLVLIGSVLARLDGGALLPLVNTIWREGDLELGDDLTEFLQRYHAAPGVPALQLPEGAMHTETDITPVPCIETFDDSPLARRPLTRVAVRFRYGGIVVDADTQTPWAFDRANNTLYRRRTATERSALNRLRALGAQEMYSATAHRLGLALPAHIVSRTLSTLVDEGWIVEHNGQRLLAAGQLAISARSGVDWFDLTGVVRYGTHELSLLELLQRRLAGEDRVTLPDGTVGLLPQEQLDEWQAMLALGERRDDALRFKQSQLALVNVLLEALPDSDVDDTLAAAREQLRDFRAVGDEPVPEGFVGELRGYQKDALGWFAFLRRFNLGGCLADDMGLGKTVQVLALLESRRVLGVGPSLLVVPRSLVFNWVHEAARFTPQLRLVDLSHPDREDVPLGEIDADVVITTYGTLRRDVASLGQRRFDYVVLDEAQAIKNAGTVTAKAARVLQADHRLALTGTPIENRIEELWSLFEFLNPGMLGASTRFSNAARTLGAATRTSSFGGETLDGRPDSVLSRALRPVILRRTKAQVATELPPRSEQTLEVELEPKQRAFYEQLRVRYAEQVMSLVNESGMARSRMQILEALLRLRQAACHPVLADPSRAALPSAKLDALIPALQELTAEGHKALVFSQFTSFLALVKARLDAVGLSYEYLDGRTRDRGERVARFQAPEGPPIFLISLKAGGHGLNLTAAEYVYLLDPWWNPAVEAQAIDRAHRIGQSRHVIATRLVARDTIESKILELQHSKRALADAILGEDRGGLGGIGQAELELLLG